jgi:glycosyltransferase involved in cell wall biosynthesis
MRSWIWLQNTIRNKIRRSFLAKTVRGFFPAKNQLKTICIVSATRMDKKSFFSHSALGQSVQRFLNDNVILNVSYNNTEGLPTVYNLALQQSQSDIMVFLHDDIWIEDDLFLEKVLRALRDFDIIGVAGNTRISKRQPAWLFKEIKGDQFIWDHGYLSGVVKHGTPNHSSATSYGPTPAECKLLDGVFLAGNTKNMLQSKTHFDERFKFHFYDLDLCRTASKNGLRLGTWPIEILHLSIGAFGSEAWSSAYFSYLQKWKT